MLNHGPNDGWFIMVDGLVKYLAYHCPGPCKAPRSFSGLLCCVLSTRKVLVRHPFDQANDNGSFDREFMVVYAKIMVQHWVDDAYMVSS